MAEKFGAAAGRVISALVNDPWGFAQRLVNGVLQGFQDFFGGLKDTLPDKLMGWLTAWMEGLPPFPTTWDLTNAFVRSLALPAAPTGAMPTPSRASGSKVERVADGFLVSGRSSLPLHDPAANKTGQHLYATGSTTLLDSKTFTCDAAGRLATETDAQGVTLTDGYDYTGRRIGRHDRWVAPSVLFSGGGHLNLGDRDDVDRRDNGEPGAWLVGWASLPSRAGTRWQGLTHSSLTPPARGRRTGGQVCVWRERMA